MALGELTGAIAMLIVVAFYTPLLFMLKKRLDRKRSRKEYYHAFLSILDRVDDDDKAVDQISIVFNKISERFGLVSSRQC